MEKAVRWEQTGESRAAGISAASLNAGANALGSAIGNDSNLDRWADFELQFTCSVAPTANTVVELYLLYALDGTNYEDGSAAPIDPTKTPVGVFTARAVTSAQRVTLSHVPLSPHKFKCLLKSELDQNATGVTLTCYTYNEELQ